MEEPFEEDDCHVDPDYPTIELCSTPLLNDREYCLHQPPLEMSLKLVGEDV